MSIKSVLVPGLFAMLFSLASGAHAAPILGDTLTYTGGMVTVESLPVSSGYTSELGLYDATMVTRFINIMNDEPVGVVATFNPADYGFVAGDELIFGILIVSGDVGKEYFMGGASRNPDNVVHAGVESMGVGVFVVGFEDLYGGGDLDYNDNVFQFTGAITRDTPATPVPEPATLSLFGFGLAAAARRYRRRS